MSRAAVRSTRHRWLWVALALVLSVAGRAARSGGSDRPRRAFAWLDPRARPEGWHVAETRAGAALAYPPGWRAVRTDAGTASAAPAGENGVFTGYLNATPRSGDETLANWRGFRIAHLTSEGARRVHLESAWTNLAFGSDRESCVIDTYTTSRAAFREIACIIAGRHGTTVVVGAAPTADWFGKAAVLERAIASFAA
jgi:hypothetical protein